MTVAIREFIWIVLALAASAATLVVAGLVGNAADSYFDNSALVRLSVAFGAWPLFASAVTLALAWANWGAEVRRRLPRALLFGAIGAAYSAVCAAALVIWTEGHFGRFDPEYAGPTIWLPLLAGTLTVAITWALAFDGHPGSVAVVIVVGMSAVIGGLGVINLPGALNGITPAGIPLIVSFLSAGTVALVGLLLVLWPRAARSRA